MEAASLKSGHPDADQLAAFAERKLPRGEREEIIAHLADCADCREVVGLVSTAEAQRAAGNPALIWWRAAAAFAAMALVVAATWGIRVAIRSPEETIPQTTALIRSPESPESARLAAAAPAISDIAPVPTKPHAARHKALTRKRALAPPPPEPAPPQAASPQAVSSQAAVSQAVAPAAESARLQPPLPRPEEASRSSAQRFGQSKFAFRDARAAFTHLSTAWRVNDGAVEHSIDGGETWQPILVNESIKFHAIAADGLDVWVGGPNGALFHSPDGGSHWSRIQVRDAAGYMTGAVVSIRLPRASEIVLETDSGEQWISLRKGLDWRRL